MVWLDSAKQWARIIKRDVIALWLAARDGRTPIAAKIVAGGIAAYALSPIDLIPDFIPIFGYLDDLLIVPLGILLATRMISVALMSEFRAAAADKAERPVSRAGLLFMLVIWALLTIFAAWVGWKYLAG
ncbi:YkvA family protein [Pararhizobium sp. YC-54]|uniref:YkvA family protein n=1 Tax=Pararhizobium sp. YC-54 TaxID=2986920 RepID=UPI003557D89D